MLIYYNYYVFRWLKTLTSASEEPKRNSPIGRFLSIDCQPTYFIVIGQKVYVQVSSFAMTLLIWFSNHYITIIYYKDAALFMQEFIFDLHESDV